MADQRTPRTKFIIGFLVGFIVGLFGYPVYIIANSMDISIPIGLSISIGLGIAGGMLMQLDKSRTIDPKSTIFVTNDFDSGKSFRLGKTNISPAALAATSAILGTLSLFRFPLVVVPLAFVTGVAAIGKELRGKKRIGIVTLAIIGIITSLLGAMWFFATQFQSDFVV